MQFGCMLQRGYYPTAYEDKLSGTFIISSAHDAISGLQLSELGTYEVLVQATTTMHQTFSEISHLRTLRPHTNLVYRQMRVHPSTTSHYLGVQTQDMFHGKDGIPMRCWLEVPRHSETRASP